MVSSGAESSVTPGGGGRAEQLAVHKLVHETCKLERRTGMEVPSLLNLKLSSLQPGYSLNCIKFPTDTNKKPLLVFLTILCITGCGSSTGGLQVLDHVVHADWAIPR